MAEPAQAQLAISHLDRIRLFGKILRVNSSKHQLVQMPKDGHQVRIFLFLFIQIFLSMFNLFELLTFKCLTRFFTKCYRE